MARPAEREPAAKTPKTTSRHQAATKPAGAGYEAGGSAETSCEMRNEYLDRALVVPTLYAAGAAFFDPA